MRSETCFDASLLLNDAFFGMQDAVEASSSRRNERSECATVGFGRDSRFVKGRQYSGGGDEPTRAPGTARSGGGGDSEQGSTTLTRLGITPHPVSHRTDPIKPPAPHHDPPFFMAIFGQVLVYSHPTPYPVLATIGLLLFLLDVCSSLITYHL